jgi:hypothetical protein
VKTLKDRTRNHLHNSVFTFKYESGILNLRNHVPYESGHRQKYRLIEYLIKILFEKFPNIYEHGL